MMTVKPITQEEIEAHRAKLPPLGPCPIYGDKYPCGVENLTHDPRAPYLATCEVGKKADHKRLGYNFSTLFGVLLVKHWDDVRGDAPA